MARATPSVSTTMLKRRPPSLETPAARRELGRMEVRACCRGPRVSRGMPHEGTVLFAPEPRARENAEVVAPTDLGEGCEKPGPRVRPRPLAHAGGCHGIVRE